MSGSLRAISFSLALLAAGSAVAKPLSAETGGGRAATLDPARDLAARRFHAGSARYADGDYAAALREFEAGYAAKASPPFLVNIGQCLRRLDRLDQAALAYRRFLDTRSGSPATRLEVFDALEDTLDELNRRIDSLAQSAAQFRAFLAGSDGDRLLRARVRATLDEIMSELVRIDDGLAAGFGVGRALVLPHAHAPTANANVNANVEKIRQRLTAIAATSSATATSTNQRSARSASHKHIAR